MSDRLKRRKKEPEKAGAEPAPAPLQPAFYDTGLSNAASGPEEKPTASAAPEAEPEAVEQGPAAEPVARSQPGGNGDAPRRRRRRGRGGRGRKPSGDQPGRAAVAGGEVPRAVAVAAEEGGSPVPALSDPGVTAPAAPPRPPKGTVVLAIGLPGSGKSSWFKRHQITPLSSDMLRALLFDDPTEQRFQDLIFSNLRSLLKARLIARRPMNYVDATNLTPHDRHGWIKVAKDFGYEVQAVFFDVPVEACLERNRKRERVVGEDVMRRMAGKLKPPTFEEGFSKITVVKVKQKE